MGQGLVAIQIANRSDTRLDDCPSSNRRTRRASYPANRRLRTRLAEYRAFRISFGELSASIQGWINHISHAVSWGSREPVLDTLVLFPADHQRAV